MQAAVLFNILQLSLHLSVNKQWVKEHLSDNFTLDKWLTAEHGDLAATHLDSYQLLCHWLGGCDINFGFTFVHRIDECRFMNVNHPISVQVLSYFLRNCHLIQSGFLWPLPVPLLLPHSFTTAPHAALFHVEVNTSWLWLKAKTYMRICGTLPYLQSWVCD